jgi:hypothetical protein
MDKKLKIEADYFFGEILNLYFAGVLDWTQLCSIVQGLDKKSLVFIVGTLCKMLEQVRERCWKCDLENQS